MADRLPPIFDGIAEDELLTALRSFRKVSVDYGETLIEEGEQDPSLACIVSGEVEVRTGGVALGKAGAGELVGEMALFSPDGMRTASVRTTMPCTFLLLDRPNYLRLRDAGNPVAAAIESATLDNLTNRLRMTNKRIASLAEGTAAAQFTPDPGVLKRFAKLFGGGGGRHRAGGVDKVAVLRSSRLFDGGDDAALRELAERMDAVRFDTGHFICMQGDVGREMYVLADGLVEVLVALDPERVEPLATLDPGDAFGTGALIDEFSSRMASCVARGPVTALSLARDDFREIVATRTGGASLLRTALIRGLTDQLAYANAQLAMLDLERQRRDRGANVLPLLRAGAAMDAHGRLLQEEDTERQGG